MNTGRIHTMMAITTGSMALAACQGDIAAPRENSSQMPVVADASNKGSATVTSRIIATVPSGSGGSLTFLDMGDGVSVAEVVSRTGAFVSRRLIEDQGATPLEVYLAVKPEHADAPPSLVRDHRARAGARAEPRTLSLEGPHALGLKNPGVEPYTCSGFGEWINDWKGAFVGSTNYQAAAFRHFVSGSWLFYPGSNVYNGTNTNSVTYLGACNGDSDTDLTVEIHRKVNGSWNTVHTIVLETSEKYTFHSGIPAYYRGRTMVPAFQIVDHLGIGAAWTISPGFKVGP